MTRQKPHQTELCPTVPSKKSRADTEMVAKFREWIFGQVYGKKVNMISSQKVNPQVRN